MFRVLDSEIKRIGLLESKLLIVYSVGRSRVRHGSTILGLGVQLKLKLIG